MEKTTFIYALCEPGTRTVRYIGKSDRPARRLRSHLYLSKEKSNHRECWLFSLVSNGFKPEIVILREVPESDWKEAEIRYIRLARMLGMDLVNGTSGGDGCSNPSPEVRRKISLFKRGEKTKALQSEAMLGEKNHQHGKTGSANSFFRRKHTEESRAKMRAVWAARKAAQV